MDFKDRDIRDNTDPDRQDSSDAVSTDSAANEMSSSRNEVFPSFEIAKDPLVSSSPLGPTASSKDSSGEEVLDDTDVPDPSVVDPAESDADLEPVLEEDDVVFSRKGTSIPLWFVSSSSLSVSKASCSALEPRFKIFG